MKNKYTYLYVLQGNYGFGWEDLSAENKSDLSNQYRLPYQRILQTKREYIENEGGNYRIIERREKNEVINND